MSMSVEIQRQLNTIIARQRDSDEAHDLIVVTNTDVLNRFKQEDSELLIELERSHNGRLIFRSNPNAHRETFRILDAKTEEVLAGTKE